MHTHTHHATYPTSFVPVLKLFGIMAPLYDGAADGGAGGQGGNGGSAGAGGNGGAAGGDGGGNGDAKTLTITEAEFENRIQGRVAAALKKAEKERGQAMTDEERAELEQARKEREENKRKSLEEKGRYQEALKQQEESIRKQEEGVRKPLEEKLTGITTRLRTEIVTNKLLAAASAGNAYNAEQAVRLTEAFVKLDDDFEPIVVDEKGKQRFVGANPMTPAQLMEEFLGANPHLVKAPAGSNGGGAAGGASRSGTGDLSAVQKLEAEVKELAEQYRRTRSADAQTLFRKKSAELKKLKSAA